MSKGFINRDIASVINDAIKYFPVITITGPRQSGKTTLIKHLFNQLPYYSLENIDVLNTTPMEALNVLFDLKQKIKKGE